MAAELILEFEGVTTKEYDAVNKELGIDSATGEGDWPDGLVAHSAGLNEDGHLVLIEVWDTPSTRPSSWMDASARHSPSVVFPVRHQASPGSNWSLTTISGKRPGVPSVSQRTSRLRDPVAGWETARDGAGMLAKCRFVTLTSSWLNSG